MRSSYLLLGVLVLCVLASASAFLMGEWKGPFVSGGLPFLFFYRPSAVAYSNRVYSAWVFGAEPNVTGYVYYTHSAVGDGNGFNGTLWGAAHYRTLHDPQLATLYDAATKQESLVVLYGDYEGTLHYGVLDTATGRFPNRPSTLPAVANVHSKISAVAIPTASSSGQLSQLMFTYADGNGSRWVGSATLSNGVLSEGTSFGLGGFNWPSSSEAGMFFVPPYGLGIMYQNKGDGVLLTSATPTVKRSYVRSLTIPDLALDTLYSGFNAAQLPAISGDSIAIGVTFILPSGRLSYLQLNTTNNATMPVVAGVPQTISVLNSVSISPPLVVYLSSVERVYVYCVDNTDPRFSITTVEYAEVSGGARQQIVRVKNE